MKYAFVGMALAAVAAAQSLSDIPACALPCIQDAITSSTSCSVSDFACVCENQSTLTGAATPCVIEKCGADVGVNDVLPAVNKFCAEVEAGGSSSSTSAAAPATTSSEAAPSSSAAASTYPVETTPYPTGSATTVTSLTTATSTYCPNGTISTAYPTSTFVTAGAAHIAGPVGGIAALLLGALAAF